MLVFGVRIHPAGSTVDFQGAPIEHLREAGAHVHFGGGWKTIAHRPGLKRDLMVLFNFNLISSTVLLVCLNVHTGLKYE